VRQDSNTEAGSLDGMFKWCNAQQPAEKNSRSWRHLKQQQQQRLSWWWWCSELLTSRQWTENSSTHTLTDTQRTHQGRYSL